MAYLPTIVWYLLAAIASALVLVFLSGWVAGHLPARHRRHGWSHIQQATDNYFGRFGGYYPEETERREGVPQIGRNHPCPCGSGKKYKRCCGR